MSRCLITLRLMRRFLAGTGTLLLAATAIASSSKDYATALRLTPVPERGGQRFGQCAACHYPASDESADAKIPRIAGQHASVLIKQLVEFRRADRQSERMQRVVSSHEFDLQAIADVAAFASRLRVPGPPPGPPIDPGDPTVSSYQRHCSSCHGPNGEGSAERAVPRLAGQRYDYMLEQIYDVEHGRRRNVPARHPRVLGKLDVDELRDIADYLSRLPWNGASAENQSALPESR